MRNENHDIFRDILRQVEPIRFKEPFAEQNSFCSREGKKTWPTYGEGYWRGCQEGERKEFQDLWLEKVKGMIFEKLLIYE